MPEDWERQIWRYELTNLFLVYHKKDIGKESRPRSDAAERGCDVWSGFTVFELKTGISVKYNNNKNKPDTPSVRNG